MFQHKGSEHWLSKQWLILFTLLNLTEDYMNGLGNNSAFLNYETFTYMNTTLMK